jgi:hypothetical protein
MDRRTFIQSTAATTGTLTVAGCLGGDDDPVSEITSNEGPQRYERPPYSSWPPADSYDTGPVEFLHLTLAGLRAVDQLTDSDQFDTSQPLVGLPLSSTTTIPEAVDTLTSYPFADAIQTTVEAATGTTDETAPTTLDNATAENETTENETVDSNTTTNETVERSVEASEYLGIETTELTLTDELLLCHGSYDRTVFADRYAQGFEKVDQQRGVAIYEGRGDNEGLAFGVASGTLIVPVEDSSRQSAAETILAHTLSGYFSTIDRIVDDEDGSWLFETTGSPTLSYGIWETPNAVDHISQSDATIETPPTDDPVFGSVESFVSTVRLPVDGDETISEPEARFSGLFASNSVPSEEELRTGLVGDATPTEITIEETRVALNVSFVDE